MDSRSQNQGWLLTFCFNEGHEKKAEEYTREIRIEDERSVYSFVVQ